MQFVEMSLADVNQFTVQTCLWDGCSIQFVNFDDLFRHLKEAHVNSQNPTLPRDCRWANTCNYQTTEKKHLVSHLRSHLDWRPFSCEICGSRFKHEHEIRRHVDKIHQNHTQQLIPPNPYSNNSGSALGSPQKLETHTSSVSPTIEVLVSDGDAILSEVAEYALGIREFLIFGEDKRAQLLQMGIPDNIFNVPRAQLRRSLLDGFYQNIALMPVSENQNIMSSQFPASSSFMPSSFPPHGYQGQMNMRAPESDVHFTTQQGFAALLSPYGSNIPQSIPGLPGNGGYGYPGSMTSAHQFQGMPHEVPVFPFQPAFSKQQVAGLVANNFNQTASQDLQSQNVSQCLPTGQEYSNFPDMMAFHAATHRSSRSVPPSAFNAESKKSESPSHGLPSEGSLADTSETDAPSNKYGVDSLLSSILPNIKSFLTSVPTVMRSRSNSVDGQDIPSRVKSIKESSDSEESGEAHADSDTTLNVSYTPYSYSKRTAEFTYSGRRT
ncbi:hypothetical protein DSO57_1015883 [Entomophthora muscae]|uniref:Uncharacterized protein n=1 Tax=Entomophthora muscae TaxID=34485 RepID=A0ACC2RJS1_9FUNG|nr:hypothetical protein DSO57_1015883 [Entomophthora muscae]